MITVKDKTNNCQGNFKDEIPEKFLIANRINNNTNNTATVAIPYLV
jgi:hypothetical protein